MRDLLYSYLLYDTVLLKDASTTHVSMKCFWRKEVHMEYQAVRKSPFRLSHEWQVPAYNHNGDIQ